MSDKKPYVVGDDESKKTDSFLKKNESEEKIFSKAKDLIVSETEKEFIKLGYEPIDDETYQGVYGDKDGNKYGKGSKSNKFSIKLEGRTKGNIVKTVSLGAKRSQSVINIIFKDSNFEIEYKSTERGFFRGVDSNGKTIMIDEKRTIKNSGFESEMKKFFTECAKKEISYLTDTKIGVEDKTEKSTTSVVENKEFKLKNIMENNKSKLDPKSVIDKKTIPLDKTEKGKKADNELKNKKLFFDNKDMKNEKATKEMSVAKCKKCQHKFNTLAISENGTEYVKCPKCNNRVPKEESIKEITASGPTGAGAGAFLTNRFLKTSYAKNQSNKRPKIDRDYKVVPEQSTNEWHTVKIDPNTHPLGMPFVKPNSKEELKNSTSGDVNKMKRMGLSENQTAKEPLKRKFMSEIENEKLGINKRYLITEKTSDEYLKERWNKLIKIKLNETIEKDEELFGDDEFENQNNFKDIDNIPTNSNSKNITISDVDPYYNGDENLDDKELSEPEGVLGENKKTINIQKPNTWFDTAYKFYEKDFLSESKYIMDLNTKVYVPNPRILK
jgi:DNA-directed RNA polymerase subunit RPC12/RpoP